MRRSLVIAIAATLGIWTGGASLAADVAASAEEIRPLLVGSEVPELTLRSADGSDFDLRAETREQRAIFIFYRGGW